MWAAVMLGSWVGGLVAINPRNFDTHSLLHTLYIHIPFEVVKLCFYDFIFLTKIMFSKHNFNPCHCVYMYNEYTTASMSNNHYPVNCNHKLSTKEHKRPKKNKHTNPKTKAKHRGGTIATFSFHKFQIHNDWSNNSDHY